MSVENFLSESETYLKNRKSQLSKSLSVLENLASGSASTQSVLTSSVLDSVRSIISSYGNYNDTSQLFEPYVEEVVEDVLSGSSSDEQGQMMNRATIATLGSLLATETTTPHYLAKKTADILSIKLGDRDEILSSIKSSLENARAEILLIDDSWYSDFMNDTTSALNDVNNAIGNMLTVRSYVENYNSVNDTVIGFVKSNVSSAIGHLSRVNSPVSVLNLVYSINNIKDQITALEFIDEEINVYLENLKNFKTNFQEACNSGNRFIGYVKESAERQYSDLLSIRRSMKEVVDRGDSGVALRQAPDWIKQLSTIGSFSDTQVSDFCVDVNDSSNSETVKLENLISLINHPSRSLDLNIASEVLSTLGRIAQVTNISIDSTSVIDDIDSTIVLIDNDTTSTSVVTADLSDYDPNPVEALDEFISFIETIDLDRLKYILISSDWGRIFTLVENGLTHSEIISLFINPFINTIDDDEVRNMVLSLSFRIASERRINRIKSITFSTVKDMAVNSLRTGRIRDVEVMTGQLEQLRLRLS